MCCEPAASNASSATAVRPCSTSERQRTGENDGCLNATPSSEGEAACLIPGGLFFCGCQERHDRVGDGIGGSPGQVMTRAVDELQAGIWQGAGEPTGGIEGYQGVPGVGEQQDGRLDRRDGVLELAELAEQGALLGQEGAPQRAVSAARVAPDLPVGVLVRA